MDPNAVILEDVTPAHPSPEETGLGISISGLRLHQKIFLCHMDTLEPEAWCCAFWSYGVTSPLEIPPLLQAEE